MTLVQLLYESEPNFKVNFHCISCTLSCSILTTKDHLQHLYKNVSYKLLPDSIHQLTSRISYHLWINADHLRILGTVYQKQIILKHENLTHHNLESKLISLSLADHTVALFYKIIPAIIQIRVACTQTSTHLLTHPFWYTKKTKQRSVLKIWTIYAKWSTGNKLNQHLWG
jgi:hypothetical protein